MSPQQCELEFRATGGGMTQNDRLEAIFREHPGEWLPMPDLARGIRAYAVHSRVADLRRRGMQIESRSTTQPGTRQRHSFYLWAP